MPISIKFTIQPSIRQVIYYRNIVYIDIHNFIIEFRSSICDRNVTTINLNESLIIYLLDKYAPLKIKFVRKEIADLFNESTLSSKKILRSKEKLYRKTRNQNTLIDLINARRNFRESIIKAIKFVYLNKIKECNGEY